MTAGELKALAALSRLASVGDALRAATTEAAVLVWLAQLAAQVERRRASRTGRRCRLLAWLGQLKAGESPGSFGRYSEADGRAALGRTARGGLAAAASELTGIDAARYLDAQRNGSRGKPRSMCRTRKRP